MQVLNYLGERGGGFGIHLISSFSGALIGFQADDHAMVFCSVFKTGMKREILVLGQGSHHMRKTVKKQTMTALGDPPP